MERKNKKSTWLIVVLGTVAVVVFITIGVIILFRSFGRMAQADEYVFGSDRVPGICSVVGKRTCTSYSMTESGKGKKVRYVYRSDTADADISDYGAHLEDAGYEKRTEEGTGNGEFYVKSSETPDMCLVVSMENGRTDYRVTVVKCQGIAEAVVQLPDV